MRKSFRGIIADDGEVRIRLGTVKGKMGYQIVKFQLLPNDPSGSSAESIVKIYDKSLGSTLPTSVIDFTESDLLAVAYYSGGSGASSPQDMVVIFDNQIFNQDIFISHNDNSSAPAPTNFYLELELHPLTDQGAEYTTLRDIRTQKQ